MSKSVDSQVAWDLGDAEKRRACADSFNDLSRKDFERRRATGELVSPLPRLYARADYWNALTPREKKLHELRGLMRLYDWITCGPTAALAHGLSVPNSQLDPILIADDHGTRSLLKGKVRTKYTRGDNPILVDGIWATSLMQTLFDCARWLGLREAIVILDSALSQGRTTKEELIDYIEKKQAGYRGIQKARAAGAFADGKSQSGGESYTRAVMHELGFAAPDLQTKLMDPIEGRPYFLDFSWTLEDDRLIAAELDGGEKYTDPAMTRGKSTLEVMRQERLRESRLTSCCDAIIRFSFKDVLDARKFNALLESFGVPKDHKPLVKLPKQVDPCDEEVPIEAYGL